MVDLPRFVPTYHHDPYPAIDPVHTDLREKVVVLTGGASGIGRGISRAFAQARVKALVILDRDQTALFDVRDELAKEFGHQSQFYAFVANIDDMELIDELFDKIQKDVGRVGILVSNAAYGAKPAGFGTISTARWFRAFETNVRSSYHLASAFIRQAQPGGVLIQVTSVLSHYRTVNGEIDGQSAYSGAKLGMARALEVFQHEKPELRVISVHPGLVPTAMSALNDGHKVSKDSRKKFPQLCLIDTGAEWFSLASLSGQFIVWCTGPDAQFLAGRTVWANWDVTEMKQRETEIVQKNLLTIDLRGLTE